MEDEKVKNPEEYATKDVNKRIGKLIADRRWKIKQLQAEIKKIEKQIEKIKGGELLPDEDCSSSGEKDTRCSLSSSLFGKPASSFNKTGFYSNSFTSQVRNK